MALQDVDTRSSSNKACTLFDDGSEQTLISNILTNKNNIPYDEARYSTFCGEWWQGCLCQCILRQ